MDIQISRNGEVIGEISKEQLNDALVAGTIFFDDYAWHEGMIEWKPVGELIGALHPTQESPSLQRTETPATLKATKESKPKKQSKPKHDWRQDPASLKQLSYLESFGLVPQQGLTKGTASELIEKCQNDPQAQERQERIREAKYEQQRRERIAFPSFYLKADVASAADDVGKLKSDREKTKAEIATKIKELSLLQTKLRETTQKEEKNDIQEEIDSVKDEIEFSQLELTDYPENQKESKDELKYAQANRVAFWKATFKEDWILSDRDGQLFDFGDSIDKLYTSHGHYFKSPTNKQIVEILDSLDKTSPTWDKHEPQAFYATLKASFPDSMRKNAKNKAAHGQGCLVVLVLAIILFLVAIAKQA